jgi:hypothetical protein
MALRFLSQALIQSFTDASKLTRMKKFLSCVFMLAFSYTGMCQVDTTFIYNSSTPYGLLDIRLRKSSTQYYYLQLGKTFSFRESSPGVRTNKFKDMTSWDSSPYTEGNLREKTSTADNFVMNFRLLLPNNYNSSYSPGYPMIVMMHGAGERGNCWESDCHHADRTWNPVSNSPAAPKTVDHPLLNNDHNLLHGGKPHLDARNLAGSKLPNDPALDPRAFPGFVLFPQNLNGWSGATIHDAIRLIRLVVKKYRIDPDRIVIHGLSNGAYGTYEMIKRAPWLFAAALPMSAPYEANIISQNMAPKISHIPLWIFQGGLDLDPTPARTEGFVKKFREAGTVVRYTKYDHLGHGVWNTAYKEPEFFKWILQQHRSKLHVFAGVPKICSTNGQGVQLQMPEGFFAYQWEKNGAIISGATSAKYVATSTGTYRGRFSRKKSPTSSDWNEWSPSVSVTSQSPAKAVMKQQGTVLLKDLNGGNEAKLIASGEFDHYYWYRNGTKLSINDTVSHATIKAGTCSGTCTGNGTYTLVVANYDNCPSPASDSKVLYFNDQAPVNLTAPSTFTGSTVSASSVRVNWKDMSSGEIGFEIWKRKVISSTSFSPWSMSGLTAANATTFTDNGLEPNSTYHYKIRAVSKSGRSNYTPSSATSYLVLKTGADTSAPGAPSGLAASQTGVGKLSLSWNAATDNTGIREYIVYYTTSGTTQSVSTGSNVPKFTLTGLPVNRSYSIQVRAKDLGGNVGSASSSVSANTYVSGLYYEHSTGAWSDLDAINWNIAEYTGKTSNYNLGLKVQDDFFNFKFDGYIYINTAGTYYFSTASNDGSRLELNGKVIVENDGIHSTKTVESAAQSLTTGGKRIIVKFFEYDGGEILKVSYKGPDTGNAWVTIPSTALKSSATSGSSIEDEVEVLEEVTVNEDAVSVFPNPTDQNNINVKVDDAEEGPVNIQMIDLSGRGMYNQTFESEAVREGVQVQPTVTLQEGMYVIIIRENRRTRQKMLAIKQ